MLTADYYLQYEEGYHNYVIAKAEYLQSHRHDKHSRLLKKSKAKCAVHHSLLVEMVKRECSLRVMQRALANTDVNPIRVDETNIARYIKKHIAVKIDPETMQEPSDIVRKEKPSTSPFPNMF